MLVTMLYDVQRIERARILRGWTKTELARRIKKDPSTISLIERGKVIGRPATMKAIADALKISMERLLKRGGDRHDAILYPENPSESSRKSQAEFGRG